MSGQAGKVVATMLCGNNQELVADAVRSVIDCVDELLLIDTGITDDSARIVRELCGPKFAQVGFTWCNDFAAARNAALRLATERGATWALTIDTDERLVFEDLRSSRQLLSRLNSVAGIAAWLVADRKGSYSKARIVRVPTSLAWRGRTLVDNASNCGRIPHRFGPRLALGEFAMRRLITFLRCFLQGGGAQRR